MVCCSTSNTKSNNKKQTLRNHLVETSIVVVKSSKSYSLFVSILTIAEEKKECGR
jgi:hypothetical protein